jgi:hypothetical protein
VNSGLRQPRTGVADGGVGVGTAERDEGAGGTDVGGTDTTEDEGTEAGAAAPATGPAPQPATRKGIANNKILRRIFPPAATIRQNEAEP